MRSSMSRKNGKWKKVSGKDIGKMLRQPKYKDTLSIAYDRLKDMYAYNYENSFNQETRTPSPEYSDLVINYLHMEDDNA